MTGCGCLLVALTLAGLLVLLIRGSTDAGESLEQAVTLAVAAAAALSAARGLSARAAE